MAIKKSVSDDLQEFRSFEESILEIDQDAFEEALKDPKINDFQQKAVDFFLEMEREGRNLF